MFSILSLAACALLAAPLQDPSVVASTPVVVGKSVYAVNLLSTGNVAAVRVLPATPPAADRRQIVTRWRDARGVEHKAATSYPTSRSRDEVRRLVREHYELVAMMQEHHPPVPPATPPGGSGTGQ